MRERDRSIDVVDVLAPQSRRIVDLVRGAMNADNASSQLIRWLSDEHAFDMAPHAVSPPDGIFGDQNDVILRVTPNVADLSILDGAATIIRAGCCLIAHRDMETFNQQSRSRGGLDQNTLAAYFDRMPTLSMLLGTSIPLAVGTSDHKRILPMAIHFEDIGFFDYAVKAIMGSIAGNEDESSDYKVISWDTIEKKKRQFPELWFAMEGEIDRVTTIMRRYSRLLHGRSGEIFPLLWSKMRDIPKATKDWIGTLNAFLSDEVIHERYFRASVVGTYVGGDPFIQMVDAFLNNQAITSGRITKQVIVKPADHCETPPTMTSAVDQTTRSFVQAFKTFCRMHPMGSGHLTNVGMVAYVPPLVGHKGSALALEHERNALRMDNRDEWLRSLQESLERPFPLLENKAVLTGIALSAIPGVRDAVVPMLDLESERIASARPDSAIRSVEQHLTQLKARKEELSGNLAQPLDSPRSLEMHMLKSELAQLMLSTAPVDVERAKGVSAQIKQLKEAKRIQHEAREAPIRHVQAQLDEAQKTINALQRERKERKRQFERSVVDEIKQEGRLLIDQINDTVVTLGF